MNLMNVFLDGNLVFSNNLAERTIRVVTVGRKCSLWPLVILTFR
ncbi:MAG: IS66 family transposase [Clostridiales bacterium]|nr:IS66 family transposase [Clostridiales bacterium]